MGQMLIRMMRLTNERHRFEAVRADGSVERLELETRSFLLHDLVHFAVESAGQLDQGFFGLLARGEAYEASADTFAGETGRVEKVVAMLQGALKGEVDTTAFVERARAAFVAVDEAAPDWLTPEVVARSLEILRRLQGRWRATPFGGVMELAFSMPLCRHSGAN